MEYCIDKSMVSESFIAEFNRKKKILNDEFIGFKALCDQWQFINFIEGKHFRIWTLATINDIPHFTFYLADKAIEDEAQDFAIYLAEHFEFALTENVNEYSGLVWQSFKPVTLPDGTQAYLSFQVSKTIPDKYLVHERTWTSKSFSCKK